MKLAAYFVVLMAVAGVRPAASALVIDEGGYTDPPMPYMVVHGTPSGGFVNGILGPKFVKTCGIEVFAAANNQGGGFTRHYYYLEETPQIIGGKKYCYGRPVGEWTGWIAGIAPNVQNVRLPYVSTELFGGSHTYKCYGALYVNVGGLAWYAMAMQTTDICGRIVAPVTCTAVAPETLDHGSVSTGRITNEAVRSLQVNCSGRTTVKVSVLADVHLGSGANKIKSQLFAGAYGTTVVSADASPTAVIDLISVINTEQDAAGAYTGTGLITVEWA